jgi:hypothetical protein
MQYNPTNPSDFVKIRSINAVGDWNFGQGLGSYNMGLKAIEEDVLTRQLSFKNDAFWNLQFGVDWWNLLGSKNPAAENGILTQTREMLIGAPGGVPAFGIVTINSVGVSEDPISRGISVSYSANTIYSQTISGVATPTLGVPGT